MTETSREVLESFLACMQSHGVREAFERYAVESYIQHNPKARAGREGAIAYLEDELSRGCRGTIKRMIADGDIVVLHLHLEFTDGSPALAVMDMFRVENGKIVEHWDVSQEIPKTTVSGNSMF